MGSGWRRFVKVLAMAGSVARAELGNRAGLVGAARVAFTAARRDPAPSP